MSKGCIGPNPSYLVARSYKYGLTSTVLSAVRANSLLVLAALFDYLETRMYFILILILGLYMRQTDRITEINSSNIEVLTISGKVH